MPGLGKPPAVLPRWSFFASLFICVAWRTAPGIILPRAVHRRAETGTVVALLTLLVLLAMHDAPDQLM
jgi:hypothetical protein